MPMRPCLAPIPARTAVLAFDDAVKSHLTVVAPLLQEHGFGATFFITHAWMEDRENFLTWEEVAELHRMGFEIGNHTWTHANFGDPASAARLPEELDRVDQELARVGVPRPTSFGWPGNSFGPEALAIVRAAGYLFARRGMQPEFPYGQICPGPLYDPARHDPHLIPTAADAYPQWTMEHFRAATDRAQPGRVLVLQFHGVPDPIHPWVHTPPEMFRQYLDHLKREAFHVIALRDLGRYVDPSVHPADPLSAARYPL